MDDVIFGGSVRERRTLAAYVLSTLVVVSVAALGVGLGPVAVLCALACAVGVWIYNGGSTAVGAEGVVIRRFPLPPARVPWNTVESIDIHTDTSSHGVIRTLRLTAGGRTFRLRPLEDGIRRPDPDFDAKCARVAELWERYA